MQALLLVGAVLACYFAQRTDLAIVVKDVARHEVMITRLLDVETKLTENHTKVAATLEGIERLMNDHLRGGTRP